ncbi:hypothetical protein SSPO_099680 [Streptomyces antimycoticus]|uniref:Uncharacterized protein n=1 Tax=Streptomyces antimycoticus TaxID=68175 RepID=A0A499V350_9ACTN|nr:hypothetical protein SSPO_099680 [Streptomyces antimycoticus]
MRAPLTSGSVGGLSVVDVENGPLARAAFGASGESAACPMGANPAAGPRPDRMRAGGLPLIETPDLPQPSSHINHLSANPHLTLNGVEQQSLQAGWSGAVASAEKRTNRPTSSAGCADYTSWTSSRKATPGLSEPWKVRRLHAGYSSSSRAERGAAIAVTLLLGGDQA